MKKRITLATPIDVPEALELRLLGAILASAQAQWHAYFRGHFDGQPIHLKPVFLPWQEPLHGSHGQEPTLFAAQRLFRSGWLDSLHMDQRGLIATLPLLVPVLPEPAPLAQLAVAAPALSTAVQAFQRLLEVHQQQLLACVAGDFGNRIDCARALRVGADADVPLALAQALQAGGLVQCYTAVASREAYGADTAPAAGVAITLRVQDAMLAQSLIQRLKAS